jgi:hypothetical protein
MQASSDSEDSEDERELLLSADLTVAYEGGSEQFVGAVAEYGAQSLSTAGTAGIEIVAAKTRGTSEQFENAQEMQDKAVLVSAVSTEGDSSQPLQKIVLDKARRAQAAGARVVLIAHEDDGNRVFRPRKVPGEDGRDIEVLVLGVADKRFKATIGQALFEESVVRLHCTKPFERQMAKQHRRRATSFSSMTSLDTEPEPEPEPEPELSRTGSRSTVSWVDGYDHLNTAGELWSTTTRPEGKVAELHRRFPRAKPEAIQRALDEAQGDLEEADTILASKLSQTRSTLANQAEHMREQLERNGDKLERTASAHSREKELKQEAVSLLQDRKIVLHEINDKLQADNDRLQAENDRLQTERDSAELLARDLEQRVQWLEARNAAQEGELNVYHDSEMTEIQELRHECDVLTESNVVRTCSTREVFAAANVLRQKPFILARQSPGH